MVEALVVAMMFAALHAVVVLLSPHVAADAMIADLVPALVVDGVAGVAVMVVALAAPVAVLVEMVAVPDVAAVVAAAEAVVALRVVPAVPADVPAGACSTSACTPDP